MDMLAAVAVVAVKPAAVSVAVAASPLLLLQL